MNFMAMDLPQMNLVQMLEKMKFLLIIFEALIGTERLQDLHSSKDTSIRKVSNTGTSSIRISSSGYPKPVLHFFVNIWVNFLC